MTRNSYLIDMSKEFALIVRAEDQYSDLCESCGRVPEEIIDPKCSLCGQPPTKEKTNHYFFKLKNFQDSLSKWLDENNNLQKDVKKYVQNWIKSGLIDWDNHSRYSLGCSSSFGCCRG